VRLSRAAMHANGFTTVKSKTSIDIKRHANEKREDLPFTGRDSAAESAGVYKVDRHSREEVSVLEGPIPV
jgi:hypothetical protein